MITDEQIKQLAVSCGFKLTNETGDDLKSYVYEFARELIALAQQEPAQAVPVAWRTFDGEGGYEFRSYDANETYQDDFIKSNGAKYSGWVEPLYTHPAPLDSDTRKPLTDEEILALWPARSDVYINVKKVWFARAIERAHGIGAAND